MGGYVMKGKVLAGAAVSVGASQSNSVVSELIQISEADSLHFRADFLVSAVSGTIAAKLQTSDTPGDSNSWVDAKSVNITGTGRTAYTLLAEVSGDQQYLPLKTFARFVVTTDGGESITIDQIEVKSRL